MKTIIFAYFGVDSKEKNIKIQKREMDDGITQECEIKYETWLALGHAISTQLDLCNDLIEECEMLLSELRANYEIIKKLKNYPEKQSDLLKLQIKIADITKKMM